MAGFGCSPRQVFDGILDSVDLPYGDRVIGVGDFAFAPTPKASPLGGGMAPLWKDATPDEVGNAVAAGRDDGNAGTSQGAAAPVGADATVGPPNAEGTACVPTAANPDL